MSQSYDLPATAETFRCGILSSKLAAIFDRKAGTKISEADRPDVLAAASLVRDILNGAKTLSDRSAVTGVTSDGIRSLGLALNPLERLARLSEGTSPTDETILILLSRIYDTLNQASASSVIPEEGEPTLVVRDFFGFLADAMLSNIGRPRDRISQHSQVVSEVSRIGLARAARIVSRLQEILAQDFPTSTPEFFAHLIQRLVEGIAALLRTSTLDERTEKFACSLIAELGSHLRYVESATSSRVPASFIQPIESLIAKVTPSSRVMLRVQWTFNYKVFDIAEYYRRMIDPLLGTDSLKSYLDGLQHFYIVSVPSIENVNALLHCIVGHEFGHRIARSYLDQEDQEQLIKSIWERVGDLKWLPSVESLPPIFQLPIRQQIFDLILQARKRALEELISDLVGYFLFGAGAVFALAEVATTDIWDNLPSAQNDYYPPWRFRLREILRLALADGLRTAVIELDGGDPIASIRAASVKRLEDLERIASVTTDLEAIEADEQLKRAYQDISDLLKSVPDFIAEQLGSVRLGMFSKSISPLLSRLALGLPPDDVDASAADFRLAMTAGWLYRLARLPIPHNAERSWESDDDDTLNRLVLKAIESIQLSSQFQEWLSSNAVKA